MKKKLLCALLTLTMCTGLLPMTAVAAECDHHTVHTADCGYVGAVEGTNCTHEHDTECYEQVLDCQHEHGDCSYVAEVEGTGCTHECGEDCAESCIHTEHDDLCGYIDGTEEVSCDHECTEACMVEKQNCQHEHDADCGYSEGTEGSPCLFQCEECNVVEEPTEEQPVILAELDETETTTDGSCAEEGCTGDYVNGFCNKVDTHYEAAVLDDGVYEIGNAGQLYWFANLVNTQELDGTPDIFNVVLTDDIVVNENVLDANGELNSTPARMWTPIGYIDGSSENRAFVGSFDGQMHTISGLYAGYTDRSDVGLFGYAEGYGNRVTVIEKLIILDSYFSGDIYIGSISGHTDANVRLFNVGSNATISGNRTYSFNYVGGLVGGLIKDAYSCFFAGKVSSACSGDSEVYPLFKNGKNTHCYYLAEKETADGGKTAEQFTSGEVAYLLQQYQDTNAFGAAETQVWGQNIDNGKTTQVLPVFSDAKVYKYTNCQTKEVHYTNDVTKTGHSFDSNGFCENCNALQEAVLNNGIYEIYNTGQFCWFAEANGNTTWGLDGRLMADIDLNPGYTFTWENDALIVKKDGTNVDPTEGIRSVAITKQSYYKKTFDGNGKNISGIYINNSSADKVGLFGWVYGGTVKDLTITNSYICGNNYVGGIAGSNYDGTIENCTSSAIVCGNDYVGGITGFNYGLNYIGTIIDCTNSGAVRGNNYVGGIAGSNNDGTITDCTNSGPVVLTGESWACAGGIAGYLVYDSRISGCINSGTITNTSNTDNGISIGGICGTNGGEVSFCYNIGTVNGISKAGGICGMNSGKISSCHSYADVTGGYSVGGICGEINTTYGTVVNSYYYGTLTGTAKDTTGTKTADEFKSGAVCWLLNGETVTGNSVWKQDLDEDPYPTFEGAFVLKTDTGYENITAMPLQEDMVEIAPVTAIYNGSEQKPTVTVDGLTEGTDYTVSMPDDMTNAGEKIITVTGINNYCGTVTKTFTITQSCTTFESGAQADKAEYTYGEIITVTAKPVATGAAPVVRMSSPVANQMALFNGDTQISEAVDAVNGVYTMTCDTADKGLNMGENTLTAKYVGNDNMASYSADVTVTLNKKELTVTGATATSRAYDTTATVDITEVGFDGKVGSDSVNVSVEGLKGTLSAADAGNYTSVTLPTLTLTGDHKDYYILTQPNTAVSTNVEITKVKDKSSAAWTNPIVNNLAKEYQIDLSECEPPVGEWGDSKTYFCKITYIGDDGAYKDKIKAEIDENGILTVSVPKVETDAEGTAAVVTVAINSQNYENWTKGILLIASNKENVTLDVFTPSKSYDGAAMAEEDIEVTAKLNGAEVTDISGYTYQWKDAEGNALEQAPVNAGSYQLMVSVKSNDAKYVGSITVPVTITKGEPDVAMLYTPITSGGKTLKDAELELDGNSTPGTLAWVLPETTAVTANTEYEWKFTPNDSANYKEMTGKIILWEKAASSGGSGGGSSTSVKADNDQVTIDTSSSSVSEKDMDKAIDKAAENDADEIIIDTNKDKVTLPENMAEKITDETDADLVVETKNGTVTIPNSTLEELDAEGKVTVEVTKDSVKISDENGELSNIGKIEVTVPYKENSETGNVAVEVTKADGTKEVIEDVYDGKNSVTFEVDGSVTFEIIDDYVPLADIPVAPENPFKDVSETDWFYKAVMYVSANGLMSGVDTDKFGPSWNTTRGMITTILWRMEGKPEAGAVPFTDVKADMYYAEAIAWAAENGIVSGYGDTFGSDDNITREQLASILFRYAQYKDMYAVTMEENLGHFSDNDKISSYAVSAMNWAVGEGIISGNDDGTLNPGGHAQRAHAAQMLMKFLEN